MIKKREEIIVLNVIISREYERENGIIWRKKEEEKEKWSKFFMDQWVERYVKSIYLNVSIAVAQAGTYTQTQDLAKVQAGKGRDGLANTWWMLLIGPVRSIHPFVYVYLLSNVRASKRTILALTSSDQLQSLSLDLRLILSMYKPFNEESK